MRMKRLLPVLWLHVLAACVATPLPQPPSYELDVDAIDVSESGAVTFDGGPGALTPGSVELRITPGPLDSDPVLELGSGLVDADGSFTISVISPLENVYYFEVITANDDIFVGAVGVDASGNASEVDSGGDIDGDGSPDVIDCAPNDPELRGQRCN
jgi:hypothetical protein